MQTKALGILFGSPSSTKKYEAHRTSRKLIERLKEHHSIVPSDVTVRNRETNRLK